MGSYNKGDTVSWSWGNGSASGKIIEKHKDDVTKTIKGSEVTKHGTEDNPAILIEQDDGTQVLKLESEVEKES